MGVFVVKLVERYAFLREFPNSFGSLSNIVHPTSCLHSPQILPSLLSKCSRFNGEGGQVRRLPSLYGRYSPSLSLHLWTETEPRIVTRESHFESWSVLRCRVGGPVMGT